MSFAPHLELITELLPLIRRDFPMADASLLNPTSVNPLLDGEWLQLNSSYQLTRGGAGEVTVPSYQVFAERGRFDTQAIGKTVLLFRGLYEAQTDVVTSAGLAVGDPLMVSDVVVGALTKKGLVKATGAGTHLVVGWVTRIVVSGSVTKVRYVNTQFTYLTI